VTGTRVAEIADGVYQLTTYLDEIDFSVNQYLLAGDEPLLFLRPGRRHRAPHRAPRRGLLTGPQFGAGEPTR
jgi:hypothetical protein